MIGRGSWEETNGDERLVAVKEQRAGLFRGFKGVSDTPALLYTWQTSTKEYVETVVKMSNEGKERNK